jgi:hypothetical protein
MELDLTTNLNNPAERRKQVRLKVRPDLQEVTVEQGYEAARQTCLAILGSLRRELGDLEAMPDAAADGITPDNYSFLTLYVHRESGIQLGPDKHWWKGTAINPVPLLTHALQKQSPNK